MGIPRSWYPAVIAACVLVLALSVVNLWRHVKGPERPGSGLQEEVGRVLARTVAEHLNRQGTVVMLGIDDRESAYPMQRRQAAAVRKGLEADGISVTDMVWLPPSQLMPEVGGMTVEVFARAVSPHRGADAIVSLAGVPAPGLGEDVAQVTRALQGVPPIFCVVADRSLVEPMLGAGLVQAAVCLKETGVEFEERPNDPAAWFDACYDVLSP